MAKPRASIIGWGETEYGMLDHEDRPSLMEQASYDAFRRANVTPKEVDGLISVTPRTNKAPSSIAASELAEHLGMMPGLNFGTGSGVGGASISLALKEAALAVTNDVCDYVLVVYGDNRATGLGSDVTGDISSLVGHDEFESPFGPTIPSMYAMAATKHMAEFGTTEEQLAKIASMAYDNASKQPSERAHIQTHKTVQEVLDSKMIASPLTLDQCALVSDGAAAVVVTDRETAHADHELPVDILSVGAHMTHESIHQSPNLTTTGAKKAGEKAFAEVDIDHDDLDVIGMYDAFTISVLLFLEDFGFAEKGKGGELVESGELDMDGKWPMNPHGGQLAQAHPGMAAGLISVSEMVQQLRDEAHNQVEDAEYALVNSNGGALSTQSVTILGRGA